MKKKRRKLKKKYFICMIVGLCLILLGISFIIYKSYKRSELIKDIKEHYSNYVVTNSNCNLYSFNKDKYIKSGKISKSFELELDNVKIKDDKKKYFKIKDLDYYVYYKDVKNSKENKDKVINSNYLVFNKNIKTKNKTRFNDGNKYIEINKEIELPIEYMDSDNYYVKYLNNIYSIKKDESIEEIDKVNTEEVESSYISIIDYSNISVDKLKEQLEYLKSSGYYSINLDEYKNWLSSNIRLKDKAILLTYDNENNDISSNINDYGFNIILNKDLDVKFFNTNTTTNKESKLDNLSRYKVDSSTDIEKFKKMCNGEAIKEEVVVQNNVKTNSLPDANGSATKIAVINYHFFYDPTLGEECNESICLDVKKFREQLQYLKDNGYKTLKMEEFRAWMYGEIELPARSVLLTIDDGAMGTGKHNGNKLIPILEEYDMYATLFLITGWWDVSNYVSDHLDVESHTFDMHTGNLCSNQTRGAKMLCSTKEQVLEDLKKSIDILGSNTAFCFPFYAYNDSAISSVQEVGFKLAFIGGNTKATRNSNKYKIPRYPIYNSTSLEQFINMIN